MNLDVTEPVIPNQPAICTVSGNDEACSLSVVGRKVKRADDAGQATDAISTTAANPPSIEEIVTDPPWKAGDDLTFEIKRGQAVVKKQTTVLAI